MSDEDEKLPAWAEKLDRAAKMAHTVLLVFLTVVCCLGVLSAVAMARGIIHVKSDTCGCKEPAVEQAEK